MSAATTGNSRTTHGTKSTPSRWPFNHSAHGLDACRRCGGFLVNEHCMDLDIGEGRGKQRFWAMRCIQCGDMIDEIILRNRHSTGQTHQETQSSGKGQAFPSSPHPGAKGGRYATVYDASPTIRRHATLQTTGTIR